MALRVSAAVAREPLNHNRAAAVGTKRDEERGLVEPVTHAMDLDPRDVAACLRVLHRSADNLDRIHEILLEAAALHVQTFRWRRSLLARCVRQLAKSHELDIAIDLKGYTAGGKSNIFAARLAPIQIFYLGYPGTSGKDYFDYLIADNTIITPALRKHYSEAILYLPHSYQPNDPQRELAKSNLTRSDYGLPEEAVIFCSFNQSYKISADEFEVWLELLRRVSNSVLWLLSSGDSDAVIRTKLRDRGFDENRVIFGEPLSVDKHLARLSAADIFLDSFVVNGHTSVSDALFAGLPVVTLPGSQFAARVGASLLKAAGCDYLIARDRQDYLTKALTLATEPNYLRTVKKHLNENLMRSPLYDVQTYTRSLQKLFSKAVANSFKGEQPMDISLKEAEEK